MTRAFTRRPSPWNARLAGLLDQVFSSLANVLAVVLVANVTSPEGFGRFALMYAILTLVVAVSRSYFGVRISLAMDVTSARAVTRRVLGSLTLLSVPIAVGTLATGMLVVPGGDNAIIIAVAIACPVVCLQDALRFGAVACDRPRAALLSDAVWTAVIVAVFAVPNSLGASTVVVAWLGAASLALAVGLLVLRVAPDVRGGLQELRSRHPVGESRAFGAAVTFGSSLVVVTAVAYVVSEAAAGALRGASTLIGPITVVLAYLHLARTPVMIRRQRSADFRACLAIAAVMVGLVLLWGTVLLAAPDEWGQLALGETWEGTRAVLPYTVTEYAFVGVTTASVLGLTVRGEAGRLFRLKLASSATTIAVGVSMVIAWQRVEAAAAAFAGTAIVSAMLGWWYLRRSSRSARENAGMPELVPSD